jgi:predicted GH43/DUF377 family glycosyl hydrolase
MSFAVSSALQPTPLVLADRVRVYVGVRDAEGRSRVAWVDLDRGDLSHVLAVSTEPALDLGEVGCFDENGVVPCCAVAVDDGVRLYYAGYQLGVSIRFQVFGGLAHSADGTNFTRVERVPVLDRTDDERHFRVAHSVLREGDHWRVWYGGGSDWSDDPRPTPMYDVRYLESPDGVRFPRHAGPVCVALDPETELRVGRPWVVRSADGFRMFYGVQGRGSSYRLGMASSPDGLEWTRHDADFGLEPSEHGWDSGAVAYPSVIELDGRTHLFYNGRAMGHDGFGRAELLG